MNTVINKPSDVKLNIYGDNNVIQFGKTFKPFHGTFNVGFGDVPVFNTKITIGDNCHCNGILVQIAESDFQLSIGNDCLFSDGIEIWGSDTHSIIDEHNNVTNIGRFVEIGDHCWIGRYAVILKNTKIADNCVVGIRSIVSKSFDQPNCVIAGNPAEVKKTICKWDYARPSQYMTFNS